MVIPMMYREMYWRLKAIFGRCFSGECGYGTDGKGLFKADEFLEEYISSERVKEYGNR